MGALRQLGNKIPIKCSKQLAEGLILSRFLYLIPVWGATTENNLRRTQRLMNQVARWASGKGKKEQNKYLTQQFGLVAHKRIADAA